jgi:hypothetical protein
MGLARISGLLRENARHEVGCDGVTLVLRDGNACFYAEEDSIGPLWAGQRFPIEECISGWAMLNDDEAVVADIELDERIPIDAYRPTYIRSLAMVPIGKPAIGAIGAYWARHHEATETELLALRALAENMLPLIRDRLDDAPWAPNFRLNGASAG